MTVRTAIRLFLVLLQLLSHYSVTTANSNIDPKYSDPADALKHAQSLYQEKQYNDAAPYFWHAILHAEQLPIGSSIDVQSVFKQFMQCYAVQDRLADGFAFVASESFQRNQLDMGVTYLQQALAIDPTHEQALTLQKMFTGAKHAADAKSGTQSSSNNDFKDPLNPDLDGLTPAQLYEQGAAFFSNKQLESCADVFELSCQRSEYLLGPACVNAVYCRTTVADWGFNGTTYEADMQRITQWTSQEAAQFRVTPGKEGEPFGWRRAASVHPHMVRLVVLDGLATAKYSFLMLIAPLLTFRCLPTRLHQSSNATSLKQLRIWTN